MSDFEGDIQDELQQLRQRVANAEEALERLETEDVTGTMAIVGRTATKETYPTTANAWYWIERVRLGGDEVEGGAIVVTTVEDGFFAYNLGSGIPPVGSLVICNDSGEHYTFTY
jgi:hypothetical protein